MPNNAELLNSNDDCDFRPVLNELYRLVPHRLVNPPDDDADKFNDGDNAGDKPNKVKLLTAGADDEDDDEAESHALLAVLLVDAPSSELLGEAKNLSIGDVSDTAGAEAGGCMLSISGSCKRIDDAS